MTNPTASDPALILVAEDEPPLRRDIVEELHEAGYRVQPAADGRAALDFLAGDTPPDLMLCDITMPGADGYEVLHRLRAERPELAATPFVFLTALSEPREVVEGKLQGADDYLVKPVDYDLMLATIAARLRQVDRIRSRHRDETRTLRRAVAGLSGGGAEAALDLIALGVVLLDGRGRPMHINRAVGQMGARPDLFPGGGDTLSSPDPLSNRDLQRALRDTLDAARAGEERSTGVMLHRAQTGGTLLALVCALPMDAGVAADAPHVALFLSSPDQDKRVPQSLLMDLFDLTPTEARVATALAHSTRAADVATELGVSQTTIAFHMRNLFQKTGTNRQADLIALILAGPMMIQSR